MVRLVDEALRSGQRFALPEGLASPDVTIADPATGTGTFLLGILRRIAQTTAADQGPGAVPAVVEAAVSRLIGFEMQFSPFAVAQLRLLAELRSLLGDPNATPATRLYVTDTLGNPYAEEEYLPQILMPLGESRRRANAIKWPRWGGSAGVRNPRHWVRIVRTGWRGSRSCERHCPRAPIDWPAVGARPPHGPAQCAPKAPMCFLPTSFSKGVRPICGDPGIEGVPPSIARARCPRSRALPATGNRHLTNGTLHPSPTATQGSVLVLQSSKSDGSAHAHV